ncbi:MAG: metallophosphoesterase [Clostridia bacterium]|nr:metallophosphoesterase [Clostridia bacterium]
MKIVVFSDSHRDIKTMLAIVETAAPDMIIHLGDNIYDAVEVSKHFRDIPMECVKGNCDFGSPASSYKLLEVEGKRLFITHGDTFGARLGISELVSEGKKRGADMVLYGHTHRPAIKKRKGIILMNPGSIGRYSRGSSPPSFGIIKLARSIEYKISEVDEFMKNP